MNKLKLLLHFVFLFALGCQSKLTFAQKNINDVSLVYSLYYLKNEAVGRNLENSSIGEIKLLIKAKQSKCETFYKSGKETAYFNQETNKGEVLKEFMGQELLVLLTAENWLEKNAAFQNAQFTITDFNQKINGVPCKQAIADISGGRIVVYFDPQIIITNTKYDLAFPGVQGLPVKIEWYGASNGKSSMAFELKEINYDNIPQSKFEFPSTEKYRTLSFEEAKKSGKL